jgi:FkbM family methyltransferase
MLKLIRKFDMLPGALQRPIKRTLARVGTALQLSPTGALLTEDIRRRLPRERMGVIFDVGANVGDVTTVFTINYPEARVFAFEPVEQNYRQLARVAARFKQVAAYNIGLGERAESMRFDCSGDAPSAFRVADDQSNAANPLVPMTTVDAFCEQNRIETVDYLKIDTEGYDLKVLAGAKTMLSQQRIGLAIAECSMNPDNSLHVAFCDLLAFMSPLGYRIFGFYEQTEEFMLGKPNLRRANVAFISPQVIARN